MDGMPSSRLTRQELGRVGRIRRHRSCPHEAKEGPWPTNVTYESHIPPLPPLSLSPFSKRLVVHYTQLHRPWDANTGGAPATGWIVAGPGLWEYRTRALAMIDYHGERADRVLPAFDAEVSNQNHVRAIACCVMCIGPPVVWRLEVDESKLIPGTTLHQLRTEGRADVYECFNSQFYVGHDHAHLYVSLTKELPRRTGIWLSEMGLPRELYPQVLQFLASADKSPLSATLC